LRERRSGCNISSTAALRASTWEKGYDSRKRLKEIKGQKIATSRIDLDSVLTNGEVKALIKGPH